MSRTSADDDEAYAAAGRYASHGQGRTVGMSWMMGKDLKFAVTPLGWLAIGDDRSWLHE